MFNLTMLGWAVIAGGGLLAGFIDSIAGGGGLITLPILLAVGLPPHLAIGTNKVQSVFGSATASFHYSRSGLIDWRRIWPGVVMSLLFAALGAWTIRRIDASSLKTYLPFILIALWLYVALKREQGELTRKALVRPGIFYPAAGAIIGFYDGFLGPGTGSFWTVSQVSLSGMNLKDATAATKPANFASNVGALLVFLAMGQTSLLVGLVMAAGQIAGAYLGSHLVIRHTPKIIRPFFLSVVALTIAKLLWDQFL